jgi:hypothetical protein
MANLAKSIVHITNDRVIVTEWRFDRVPIQVGIATTMTM